MLITEYSSEWIDHFERIKEMLLKALDKLDVNIEHVGSTAVPRLAAKSIIDIDIIYNHGVDFEDIKKSLQALGYYHNGNQGIEGREVFKRNGQTNDETLDKIAHHTYVCKYDSEELRRHILFRDYLRKNKTAREFYGNLKYKIAEETNNDRKRYAETKVLKVQSFIDYIIVLSRLGNKNIDE